MKPGLVAVDLGAESCRVSLLRWRGRHSSAVMVRRFANGPVFDGHSYRWNLDRICSELTAALRTCAELTPEGIAAIGVTGWAVDYVRLDPSGHPLHPPFCYRDPRNAAAMDAVHDILPAETLYARTGVQIQPINTLYQLFADRSSGIPDSAPWLNLPEYILHWLGAPPCAEYTNATHTGLIHPDTRQWDEEVFRALGLDLAAAPPLVPAGSILGPIGGPLSHLPAFAGTALIAPACHDTASAIAGIASHSGPWAYLSSGTWSLLGMLLPETHRTPEARAAGFTNLGAAGGGVLFHSGAAGMWLLRQCMDTWDRRSPWTLPDLIAAACSLPDPPDLLDLDDPAFLPPGDMPARINQQRLRRGLAPLPSGCESAPHYAGLIFHSLAARYAALLRRIGAIAGRQPQRICIVGGGSRNEYLNALTSAATGLPVECGAVESSTLGNFAIQSARLRQRHDGVSPSSIAEQVSGLAGMQFS